MFHHQLPGISRALYRVFVAPQLARTALLPRQSPIAAPQFALLSRTSVRTKSWRKDTQRHALSDTYTIDNDIRAPYINLIDINGAYQAQVARADVLYNRELEHLLLIQPGKTDEIGNPDPSSLPVCKIVSKIDLRIQHRKKLDIERRQAKGLSTGPTPKTLEFNWAIAVGDLKHRLNKLREFLTEGRKVEIMLGPKRRGRVATADECNSVLRTIREAVKEIRGATETKDPEGTVGGVLTLSFEGRKLDNKEKDKAKEERGKQR